MTTLEFKQLFMESQLATFIADYESKCRQYYTNLYEEYIQATKDIDSYQPFIDSINKMNESFDNKHTDYVTWLYPNDSEKLESLENNRIYEAKRLRNLYLREMWAVKYGYDTTLSPNDPRNAKIKNSFNYRLSWEFSDPETVNEKIEKYVQQRVEENFIKMMRCIVKKIKNIDVVNQFNIIDIEFTAMGFAGIFEFTTTDSDKTGILTLKTIEAGGYNIQCFHYRYLGKVRIKN